MTKIYELLQEQREILFDLEWSDDDEELKKRLNAIHGSVEKKLEFLTGVLAEAIAKSQVATETRKIANERLVANEKRSQKAEQRLRDFILQTMSAFDIKKVEGNILNVLAFDRKTIEYSEDYDIEQLDKRFVKIKKELDKAAVKHALDCGESLDIARFETKKTLRVS